MYYNKTQGRICKQQIIIYAHAHMSAHAYKIIKQYKLCSGNV